MTEMEIATEKEKSEKKESLLALAWSEAPELAHKSIKLALGLFVVTVVLAFTHALFAKVLNEIPVTIVLAYTIVASIVGITISSISIREKRTFFGIVSLIICTIAALLNAYMLFVIQCDAWFSIP